MRIYPLQSCSSQEFLDASKKEVLCEHLIPFKIFLYSRGSHTVVSSQYHVMADHCRVCFSRVFIVQHSHSRSIIWRQDILEERKPHLDLLNFPEFFQWNARKENIILSASYHDMCVPIRLCVPFKQSRPHKQTQLIAIIDMLPRSAATNKRTIARKRPQVRCLPKSEWKKYPCESANRWTQKVKLDCYITPLKYHTRQFSQKQHSLAKPAKGQDSQHHALLDFSFDSIQPRLIARQ